MNNWDKHDAGCVLGSRLRGKALGILSGMPSDCNRDPDKIFGELREHLEVHSTCISVTNAFTTKGKSQVRLYPSMQTTLRKLDFRLVEI